MKSSGAPVALLVNVCYLYSSTYRKVQLPADSLYSFTSFFNHKTKIHIFFVYFKATPTSPQDIFLALISGITSGRIRETIWDAGEESSYVQVKTISTVLYCFGLLKTLLNEFLI